jgi:PTH1 family peptidyl-tRNA hydrolase
MRLIVGLGNIGSRYAGNRHNVGFMVVDRLAEELEASWKEETKLKAYVATAEVDGEKVILAKPTTMMNLSGEAVQRIMQFYKLGHEDLLVIFDDLDTDFGKARLRSGGSSGGHNGVQSIIDHVGDTFGRLRVGISMNDRSVEPSESYVLRNFDESEREQLPTLVQATVDAVRTLPENGTTLTLLS